MEKEKAYLKAGDTVWTSDCALTLGDSGEWEPHPYDMPMYTDDTGQDHFVEFGPDGRAFYWAEPV